MKLGIVVIFHNEYELLEKQLLPNLKELNWPKDRIVFMDMFFDQMARWQKPSKSNDGSIQLLKHYEYEIFYKINHSLIDCVNERYNIAREKGWDALLWLDADEYITGDIESFKKAVEYLLEKANGEPTRVNVSFEDHTKIYDYKYTPQLILNPQYICQRFMHTLWFDKRDGTLLTPKANTDSITIHHDDSKRPAEKDRINNNFSVVNGRIEKQNLKMAIDSNHPWIKELSIVKNDKQD